MVNLSRFVDVLSTQRKVQATIKNVARRHPNEPDFRGAVRSQEVKIMAILDSPLAFTHR